MHVALVHSINRYCWILTICSPKRKTYQRNILLSLFLLSQSYLLGFVGTWFTCSFLV